MSGRLDDTGNFASDCKGQTGLTPLDGGKSAPDFDSQKSLRCFGGRVVCQFHATATGDRVDQASTPRTQKTGNNNQRDHGKDDASDHAGEGFLARF